jgi:hypothetical protein
MLQRSKGVNFSSNGATAVPPAPENQDAGP